MKRRDFLTGGAASEAPRLIVACVARMTVWEWRWSAVADAGAKS
ncbi:MAG: hypothetical protein U0X75_14835 [Acidobacteriota bacterium]